MDAESICYSRALDRASRAPPETRSTRGRRQLQKASQERQGRLADRAGASGAGQCHNTKTCGDIDKRSARGMGPRNVVKHESARDSLRRLGLAAQDQKSTARRPSARHWRRRAWYRYGALFYRFSASGRTLALRRRGDWKNAALRGHHTALAHLHRATLLTFSPRTSEKSCQLCPCATRANCLICSPRTSKTFCPRFSWAGFQIVWSRG